MFVTIPLKSWLFESNVVSETRELCLFSLKSQGPDVGSTAHVLGSLCSGILTWGPDTLPVI